MATSVDISPSVGNPLVTTQAGVGASPGFDAIDDRRFWMAGLQEGVLDGGSYAVTERGAGANMTVDVAADSGEGALVQGDSITAQGRYFIPPHDTASSPISIDITDGDVSNPRNDIIILEALDSSHAGGGLDKSRVRVIDGTPNASAVRGDDPGDNGTPALPDSCLLLAVLNVSVNETASIGNDDIRDRRTWARGINWSIEMSTADYTTAAGPVIMDATNLNPRFEFSGVPVEAKLLSVMDESVAATQGVVQFNLDGVALPPRAHFHQSAADYIWPLNLITPFTPTAGSHRIAPYFQANGGGTLTVFAQAAGNLQLIMSVREIIRGSASNDDLA